MGAIRKGIAWEGARTALSRVGGDLQSFKGFTVVVTGATGLIGAQVVRTLLEADDQLNLGLSIVAPVRNVGRCLKMFVKDPRVTAVAWSLGEEPHLDKNCDCFIHCACTTSSKDFAQRPVETSLGIVDGTVACLRSARAAGCKGFVYLSTMEVYGEPSAKPATEVDLGPIDPMVPRSSYPMAKLCAENLVTSFGVEYGMRCSVLRLAQTFGAGVRKDDARVFAEFARNALAGEDIILLSDGSKRNCYLSVNDAAAAVLTLAVNGEALGAYNAANPSTYCSILEMAESVLGWFGRTDASVRFGEDAARAATFRKGNDILLDCSKLESLGWSPSEKLEDMYQQMIKDWLE